MRLSGEGWWRSKELASAKLEIPVRGKFKMRLVDGPVAEIQSREASGGELWLLFHGVGGE